ncbi:MAG: PEP-CTERM sorting domain-containing protein [Proteobacteria bacterium]|nr:PEP-CTERM sorting domain-containing protein [Pseudomonadota bacterium]
MKKGFLTILAIISLMFVPLIASAVNTTYTMLDFDVNHVNSSGKINYLMETNRLIGTSLGVDRITAIPDVGPSISLVIINGMLNFTSGDHISGWSWGPGGSITITGGVNKPDGSELLPEGTVLMSGILGNAMVSPVTSSTFKAAISDLSDTKDPTLVSYFGFDTKSAWVGNLNISFETSLSVAEPDFFNSMRANSGDVYNTPVPIPPTILLLGAGLMGVGFIRKKVV